MARSSRRTARSGLILGLILQVSGTYILFKYLAQLGEGRAARLRPSPSSPHMIILYMARSNLRPDLEDEDLTLAVPLLNLAAKKK